jgi:hypothetical protein
LGGLGVLLCGGYLPAAAASPYGRPLARYRSEKLPDELQAGLNVYLVHPHRQPHVFGLSGGMRAVPGAVFTTGGYPVRAAASGIVHFIGQRSLPGAAFDGYYIRIAHDLYDGLKKPIYPRVTLYRHQAYRSTYYGLQTVDVVHWQSVQRGQVIGQLREQAQGLLRFEALQKFGEALSGFALREGDLQSRIDFRHHPQAQFVRQPAKQLLGPL